eukprot:GGOE01064996.1.p3 GENE.GGOE01064996.1~~GGOE01064996.1.p3  ORF type:complete len:113 (-),score=11.32 GGOE01064996.1:203-541(-)
MSLPQLHFHSRIHVHVSLPGNLLEAFGHAFRIVYFVTPSPFPLPHPPPLLPPPSLLSCRAPLTGCLGQECRAFPFGGVLLFFTASLLLVFHLPCPPLHAFPYPPSTFLPRTF